MRNLDGIRTAFERNARALAVRPRLGRGTAVTKVRLVDGLKCEIEDGEWQMTVDATVKTGGTGAGPNPGVLGRGALGSCLAMTYVMWAARLGIELAGLEVEVQADYDVGGHYGVAEVAPGYTEVRYLVTVQSDAPEAAIMEMLDHADAHTPYLDVFANPQRMRREVRVTAVRS